MKPSIPSDRLNRVPPVPAQTDQAFTLTELLVVLATLAVLALLLVPALAGTKIDSWRTQCQNNLKQLQVGFQQFAQDHNDMLPPAGWQSSSGVGTSQMAWDCWINKYIGGNLPDSNLTFGYGTSGSQARSLEVCPADTFPKANWIGGNNPWFALRSYAMDACGPAWATGYEVGDQNRTYPLPDLTKPGMQGVGIYWTDTGSTPDWDARGYKTSVVGDPAGTILLCENTHGQQIALNIWTCICIGPQGSGSELVQIDTTTNPTQNPNSATSVNQGILLYQAHWNRFNYAFHDGHVAALTVQQTVGSGTLTAPKGMWTVVAGD
jgi:prepilin-type N-terminal cleavage/methylation domain-containing protein/prepilin-type processing-associated H-X9-DG protein